MSEEIKVALKASPVRLEALFEGKDPWKDLDGLEPSNENLDTSPEMLAKILGDSIVLSDKTQLVDYLNFCAPRISKPLAEAVEIWLTKPKDFAAAFEKWLVTNK